MYIELRRGLRVTNVDQRKKGEETANVGNNPQAYSNLISKSTGHSIPPLISQWHNQDYKKTLIRRRGKL